MLQLRIKAIRKTYILVPPSHTSSIVILRILCKISNHYTKWLTNSYCASPDLWTEALLLWCAFRSLGPEFAASRIAWPMIWCCMKKNKLHRRLLFIFTPSFNRLLHWVSFLIKDKCFFAVKTHSCTGTLPFERLPFHFPTGVSIAIPYPTAISCSPAPLYYALFF